MQTRARYAGALLVAFAMVVAACGDDEPSATEAPTQPPTAPPTTAVPTPTTSPTPVDDPTTEPCDPESPHPAGLAKYSLMSGGVERTYFVHVPPDYRADQAWPLTVGLHGLTWPAEDWFNSTWRASAPELGHILVLPEAIDFDWADRTRDPDVPFILGVLDDVAGRVCVDQARIYASGGSDGADMVTRLACEAGGRFAAVRPYIGMNYPGIFDTEPCRQSVPVPMTSYIGTDEPYYDLADIDAGLAMWAERNGCVGDPVTEDVSDGVTVTRYGDCDQGAVVELYTLRSVAHLAAQRECGGNIPGFCVTYPFDTTDTMVQFFARFSR